MNFINRYINGAEASIYYYAEEFSEDSSTVIFSIGEADGLALISKADPNGNLIWEKTYQFSGSSEKLSTISFRKIIKTNFIPLRQASGAEIEEPSFGYPQYILHATNGTKHWLVSIAPDGYILWCNEVIWGNEDVAFYLEPSPTDDGFYIVISDKVGASDMEEISIGNSNPFIAKFDSYCNITVSRLLSVESGFSIVTAVKSYSAGIVIAGHYSTGFIVELSPLLSINGCTLIGQPNIVIHDIDITTSDNFLVSGYLTTLNRLFVAEVVNNSAGTAQMYSLIGTSYHGSKLRVGDDGFYFLQYYGRNSTVHRFGNNFTLQWSKTLDFDNTGNGIPFLNYHNGSQCLTFNAADESLISLLVHTNDALASCKTITLESPSLESETYLATTGQVSLKKALLLIESFDITLIVNEPVKNEYCPVGGGGVVIDINTQLQSPNFYIQGAGSTGEDGSARGIHLRWLFNGALGKKHLPKGDHATTPYNFNKPDDFVQVYRAPYIKAQIVLDFSDTPYLTDDINKVWLYRIGTKVFYVYFRNTVKYTQVRATISPAADPSGFLTAYGNELLEIENKKELFFAVEINVDISGVNASLQTETLSVAENALAVSKILSSRKTHTGAELDYIRLICENGRSIRIRTAACSLVNIFFECYTDFVVATNGREGWQLIDKYALTLDDGVALNRLEPTLALVDGKWKRYNDNAFVRISNYRDKWNGTRESWDRNIKTVVQKYIELSDVQSNPQALENVPMESGASTADDSLELSNLDLLNMAAYDFHIARMLGLGTMDVSISVTEGQTFVYIAKYSTTGDLEDGGGARTVHHLSMSLPVSVNNQRLPLPIKLKNLTPGAFWGNESPDPVNLTDANGYTHDGRNRYVTIYSEDLLEDEINKPFYYTNREFNAALFTYPVYAGLEYKKNSETEWTKPELPNDPKYQNKVQSGATPHNETIPLGIPEAQKPLFVHRQKVSGTHYYGSYGINWFSRSTSASHILSIVTNIQPINPLKPPSNINALLIRKELPLLLTSASEQSRYSLIGSTADHTLIRLTFDYHTYQELIDYTIPVGADINDTNVIPADNTEIFADKVDIFFRNEVPSNVSGKALSISNHPTNDILSVIQTGNYVLTSSGQILTPAISSGTVTNYIGGLFIMGNQQFVIHQITLPTGSMQGPEFTVFKKEISNGMVINDMPAPGAQNLEAPKLIADGLFMAVENMQSASSWGSSNPLSFQVNIGTGWTVNREVITIVNDDGSTEQHLEKTRGIWDTAVIEAIPEPIDEDNNTAHKGLYKITFQNEVMSQHAQFDEYGRSVEWHQGIVRVHTTLTPNAARKTIKVLRLEQVATANKLVLYAYDPSFVTDSSYDTIITGTTSVNYYPGYKVYLYADVAAGLTEENILPEENEDVRYSIFGLRSHDVDDDYYSKISVPQLMFAQYQAEPAPPEQPSGSLYATRPDFFGRSTYSFTTKYQHRPYGVLTCRADDETLLNALYKESTIIAIRESLQAAGGTEDPYFADRWKNFINFTEIFTDGDYKSFPPGSSDAYKFPNPDSPAFFAWVNARLKDDNNKPPITATSGTIAAGHTSIKYFVKDAISNAFVPLTEIPVIYQHIKGTTHQPNAKKQTIRDRNGNVLKPTDAEFDMAPMMRITGGTDHETSFTDFTLDGTSNNIYFYGVRELNAQMQMGAFSPFLGPVKLVNTNPPEAPEIKRIMPVLENIPLGINTCIQLEVNAYPAIQNVKKIAIYRAYSQLDAQSIRSMELVKTIDLESAGIINDSVWTIKDGFENLVEIPFNEGLYYRVTALKRVVYADMDGDIIVEYAPSQPSKLTATMVVEAYSPSAPTLSFTSDPITPAGDLDNVQLEWHKTAYKATYHVYKMNTQGNWVKIHEMSSNNEVVYLLLADTDLQSGTLSTKDAAGNNIYHHFKVVAENTSGMLSLEEKMLTIRNG